MYLGENGARTLDLGAEDADESVLRGLAKGLQIAPLEDQAADLARVHRPPLLLQHHLRCLVPAPVRRGLRGGVAARARALPRSQDFIARER